MNNTLFHFRSIFFSLMTITVMFLFADNILIAHERVGLGVAIALVLATFYISHSVGHKFIFSFVPSSIIIAALALLYFIDSPAERRLFAVGVGIVYYLALLGIVRMRDEMRDETARTFFSISVMTVMFFFYAAIYGVYINFDIALWIFLLTAASFLFLITFVSLRTYSSHLRRVFLYSITISFAMIQIAWMINFWPFGYLTNAAINLLFYYILWDMALMTFMNTLSKKRTLTNVIISIILLLVVLFTSQWVLI